MIVPVQVEVMTVNCKCDHCGCSLDKYEKIWMWNEFWGCSRPHVQLAQEKTNILISVELKQDLRDSDLL